MPLFIFIPIVGSVEYTFWRGYAKTPVLTDVELMRELPAELLATGIRRGKAIRRRRLFVERESQKDARTAAAVVDR